MFYGLIIRMYYAPKEHPPAHFHVYYAEFKATVDINTCEMLKGILPKNLYSHGQSCIKKNYLPIGPY